MKNLAFQFYLTVCCHIAWTQGLGEGYFYGRPGATPLADLPGSYQQNVGHLGPFGSDYYQQLRPPPQTNGAPIQYAFGQQNLQYNQNYASQQQYYSLNGPASNFGVPNQNSLNNANFGQSQLFNSAADHLQRMEFRLQGDNQGFNSIDHSTEPIVGQFKPELVDLNNGGPLTRRITTCGPNNNCKTIVLQSDINRQLGVFREQNNSNQNQHVHHEFHSNEIDGSRKGNIDYRNGDDSLRRPPGRRLIEYTEIPRNDIYN